MLYLATPLYTLYPQEGYLAAPRKEGLEEAQCLTLGPRFLLEVYNCIYRPTI